MYRSNFLIKCTGFSLILLSANTFAGTMGAATIQLSIPDLKPGFEANGAVLWLKPGASNLNYVILNKELPAQSPTWSEQELKPSYAPGFELGLGYVIPNGGGKDLQVHWTHLTTSTSSSVSAPNSSYFLGPDYEIGPGGLPIRNATGKVKFKYDTIDLNAGQYLNFGEQLRLRFLGGLSAGFLREEVSADYSGSRPVGPYAGPFNMNQKVTSNFSGVGPQLGLHADYVSHYGFGLLGEGTISALIGGLKTNTKYVGSGVELQTVYNQSINYQTIKDETVTQVIPGLSGKLGVNYNRVIKNDMLFKIEAGYQAAVYMNAISQYLPSSLVLGQGLESGGIFVATMNHTLSNYSVHGPFLNFSLKC